MAQKQLLHELLQEDQEPFRLKAYISDRRSQMKKLSPTTTTLQIKKPKPIIREPSSSTSGANLCRHACFLSFQKSPDIRKSPLFDFPSPAKSPCKSPNGGAFLHIPSRTAAVLVEAAMRIQKQHQSKAKSQSKNIRLGIFGSFLRTLKDRSKNKKRAIIGDNILRENVMKPEEKLVDESVRISCSCSNRRLSSADWTENNEDISMDFEASTSSCASECSEVINGDFLLGESRFCSSPFRFSLHQSLSSSGRRTPEFCSPAASPSRRVKQDEENYESRNPDSVQGEEDEEKEQCSPVSILEPPFEDDGRESGDAEEDDYEIGYENVQRAKLQLLNRLQRFEKLAALDPMELERKLLEESDGEELEDTGKDSENEEPLSLYRKQSVETFVTQVFNQSSHPRNMSDDMKRLVSDLIVEEKGDIICSDSNEVSVVGRIRNRLDSWKEVEFNTIDMMIGLDFKKEFDGWTKFPEQLEETAGEIELAVYGLLVEELSEELLDYVLVMN